MVDEARRAGVKPGASRAFVRNLLGEPDQVDPTSDLYDLGVAILDEQFLIIEYDDRALVTVVRVYTTN